MKFTKTTMQHCPTHLTLIMLLQYQAPLFKFSADVQQIWNKTQTNCIL